LKPGYLNVLYFVSYFSIPFWNVNYKKDKFVLWFVEL
jgi:hypothetical protein